MIFYLRSGEIRRFFVVEWFWLGRQNWDGKLKMVKLSCETKEMYMFFLWKWCSGWNGIFLRVVIGPPMVQPRVTQSARPIPFWSKFRRDLDTKQITQISQTASSTSSKPCFFGRGTVSQDHPELGIDKRLVEGASLFVALQRQLIFLKTTLRRLLGDLYSFGSMWWLYSSAETYVILLNIIYICIYI